MLNCIVLLLVVQFEFEFSEFEFELNCLNQFQKCKSVSFSSSCFQPKAPSLSFPSPASPAQPRPNSLPRSAQPSRPSCSRQLVAPPPPLTPPTGGDRLSGPSSPRRARVGLRRVCLDPATPRLAWPARQGADGAA